MDIASLYPTFQVIPLDFDHASPEYKDSFLRYRFVRQRDTIIRQHSIDTDPVDSEQYTASYRDENWFYYLHMHVNMPVDTTYLRNAMTNIYTKASVSVLLTSARCMTFPNGRLVYIKDTTLLIEDEEGVVQKSYFGSREEIMEAFARYFPQFSRDLVQAALEDENVILDFTKEVEAM